MKIRDLHVSLNEPYIFYSKCSYKKRDWKTDEPSTISHPSATYHTQICDVRWLALFSSLSTYWTIRVPTVRVFQYALAPDCIWIISLVSLLTHFNPVLFKFSSAYFKIWQTAIDKTIPGEHPVYISGSTSCVYVHWVIQARSVHR